MKIFYSIITVWILLASACGEKKKIKTGSVDFIDNIGSLKAAEVLFYKDPYGDSLRYSRFFTFYAVSDSERLHTLVSALSTRDYTIKKAVDTCRSEGKILLQLAKEQYKTIYFSTNCSACCYLYLIHQGQFIYYKMPDEMIKMLHSIKPLAAEPQSNS